MKHRNLFILILVGLCFSACNPTIDDTPKDNPVIEFESTGFPMDIFKTIVKQDKQKNIILSPLSVETAFFMAANGANGDTQKNILDVLGQTGNISTINSNYKALKDALDYQSDTTTFKMVNSVFWDDNRISVQNDFQNKMADFYNADLKKLDFDDEKSVDIINQWCSDNTEDRIKNIISEINKNEILFLINALYFIGDWKYPFPEELTYPNTFTKSDNSEIEIPFMNSLSQSFSACSKDNFQAVDLPFANTDFSMTFIMPKKENINDFINSFGLDELEDLYKSQLTPSPELKISLPKFQLEYRIELNKALKTIGMNHPFDPKIADFSNLGTSNAPFYIGTAIHKTFLKVDEKGAEGAAVTLIGFTTGSTSYSMTFDKPFMVVLKNHKTDSYIFMAKIGEPKFK